MMEFKPGIAPPHLLHAPENTSSPLPGNPDGEPCRSAEFPELTRRGLLRGGGMMAGSIVAGATVGASLGLGLPASTALGFDWFGLAGKAMPDISGKVQALKGRAFANKRQLRLGSRVPPGAFVTVSNDGRVIIAIANGSVFTLFGGSQLRLRLTRMRQGFLNLLSGALLLIAPKRGRYVVGGPQASFGIKGTVVFHQVFGPNDTTGRTMEGTIPIPAYAGSYFCTCNGAVDYLVSGRNDPYFSDQANYHNSYFIDRSQQGRIVKAPMLNHDDQLIRELASHQDGSSHDISWLRH